MGWIYGTRISNRSADARMYRHRAERSNVKWKAKGCGYKRTAGPFDRLRAGSSTALRMTVLGVGVGENKQQQELADSRYTFPP